MRKKHLDLNLVRQQVEYNPITGQFKRLKTHRAVVAGEIAGCRVESSRKRGKYYIRLSVLGTYVWAHRLAWAMMNDEWPENEIDHIDQNSENNSWVNLRQCTKEENAKNLSVYSSNTSGYPGVTLRPNGKYRARLMVNKRSVSLGDWDTPELAMLARNKAKKEAGFHENHC